jgi:hypothetical protein
MADLDDLSLDDSYLQHGVAELTPEELEELEKYVGICRNSDVDGENGLKRVESDTGQGASIARTTTDYSVNRTESGESVGSAVQEQRQKAEKIRKAKKWLLTSLVQYESERVEDRKSRHVREDKIFDTIAFAFHYLGDVRLTFGGHGVEWLNGLIKDISRLREDRDELLILDVLQPSILIVSKLLDLVPREFSTRLLQTCMDLARRVYSFHTDGKLPIKGRARGDLFNAYNNIACILIHEHKEDLAEEWIHDATQLVHDDEDDAEVFLCNSAALIAATTDNTSGVLDLLSRAEKVATDALSLRLQETLDLQHEIATRQEKLLAMEDDVLDILPPLGKEFLVRVEGEKVHKISSTVPELKSEIARLEAQLSIQAELASKCKLRIMRVLRKLANFYNRKGPQIKGPPRANHYSEKLMAAITACAPIPFKDDISNTCAIAAYYIRQAYSTDKFSRRKECYQLCLDACRRYRLCLSSSHTQSSHSTLFAQAPPIQSVSPLE